MTERYRERAGVRELPFLLHHWSGIAESDVSFSSKIACTSENIAGESTQAADKNGRDALLP